MSGPDPTSRRMAALVARLTVEHIAADEADGRAHVQTLRTMLSVVLAEWHDAMTRIRAQDATIAALRAKLRGVRR